MATFAVANNAFQCLTIQALSLISAGQPVSQSDFAQFPAIRPTSRTYVAPEFASVSPLYADVVSYPRILGSKAGEARLSMSFENISDKNAALILASFINSLSGFLPVILPTTIVAGIEDVSLARRIQLGEHLQWYFAEPPRQSSVMAGISTVQVELIGDF